MYYLNELGLVCSLGDNHAEITQRLFAGQSPVVVSDRFTPNKAVSLACASDRFSDEVKAQFAKLPLREQSRNNLLLLAVLEQIRPAVDEAIARFGRDRIGIVLGTSTSGVYETEMALRYYRKQQKFPEQFHYGQQELGSLSVALALTLGTSGPAYVHSNACASSAKAMASAARLLKMGVCDAVITGGVDTLCSLTVAGFASLESASAKQCNPLSANRDGITIGEGAAMFLMTREPATVALCGWGESSDAYHVSSPDPAGIGAEMAIEQALKRAGVIASQIDYINLHGTATPQNDAMESQVISKIFGNKVSVSSTKPFTGHTLGAASAVEAGLCWLAMQNDNSQGLMPPHLWDGVYDPNLPHLSVVNVGDSLQRPLQWVLSTSFAFGGSNAALVFGRI